jgi:branched-chain amino acid transport system permease protein
MTQITAAQAAILAINSLALGGLLFLLSSGFSLIFGLMRIPNLMHGSFFMLGAYFGVSLIGWGTNFWLAAILSGLAVAAIGGAIERFRCAGLKAGPAAGSADAGRFIIADVCLMVWTGDPCSPRPRRAAWRRAGFRYVLSDLSPPILGLRGRDRDRALIMVDWTRLGAMIRAGVDDPPIARVVASRSRNCSR